MQPLLRFHFALTALLSATQKVKLANRRFCNLATSMASLDSEMQSKTPFKLVLCGKTIADNEIAKALKSSNTLKLPENGEISILLHLELDKTSKEESFEVDSFMNSLFTGKFGRLLIWSPQLPSTHDVVSHNFCEFPVGTVCVADIQTKGRGRSKNVWESPLGGLLFSFTLQMEDGRVVPLVQYVVSLAITEAVKDVCEKKGLPCVDVKIKWPNDLYLNGLKVGGILCTSTYKSKNFNVCAGIGLNVNNEKPTTYLTTVLRNFSREAYQFGREDDFKPLRSYIITYKTWFHSEQRVIVQEKSGDKVVEHAVTIQGLTSSGYLLAIGDDNQMYELHPDGNSLDFFKGLVRRKLE